MWSKVWWPVITAGSVAAVGIPFAILSAVLAKKAKVCCYKDKEKSKVIDLEDLEIRVKK